MPDISQQTDVGYVISDLNSRIRILEGRYTLLGERLLVINQNMIEEYKKIIREIKTINTDIKDLKEEINELKDTLKHMVQEMQYFARKENLKVLEKYINLWNPMNFVTEEEVIKIINEKIIKKGDEAGGRKQPGTSKTRT